MTMNRSMVRGMTKTWIAALALGLVSLTASADPAVPAKKAPPAPAAKPVTVKLADAKGKAIGTATLTSVDNGVSIALDLHDLAAGDHAIHVHQTAKCDGPDFKSAGGHFNPDNKHHGMDNKEGPHAGDMPNFKTNAKGGVKATVVAPNVSLTAGDAHSVFTGGGTALVIHAKADDMKSDPAGNAGDRIACGTIVGDTVPAAAPTK